MSRVYEFLFVNPWSGDTRRLRGIGNTTRVALRSARRKLPVKDRGKYVTTGPAVFVKKDGR